MRIPSGRLSHQQSLTLPPIWWGDRARKGLTSHSAAWMIWTPVSGRYSQPDKALCDRITGGNLVQSNCWCVEEWTGCRVGLQLQTLYVFKTKSRKVLLNEHTSLLAARAAQALLALLRSEQGYVAFGSFAIESARASLKQSPFLAVCKQNITPAWHMQENLCRLLHALPSNWSVEARTSLPGRCHRTAYRYTRM